MRYNYDSLIGTKSGYLTVTGHTTNKLICRCECGKSIVADTWSIVHLKKKSCSSPDCIYHHNLYRDASTSHGLTGCRLYTIWNNIIARCYHPQNPNYKNYGARGIRVCNEWKNDVFSFITWANNNGYSDNLTIDRIDVNGNYEPTNCRWATYKEQSANKRDYVRTPRKATKHIWTINGQTKSGVEWCKIYNLSFPTVIYRINVLGLTPEQALNTKRNNRGRHRKESLI